MNAGFAELGLGPELVAALAQGGFTEPTGVQRRTIPQVLRGKDLMVQSRTGTGKTLAFVLPLLQGLDPQASGVSVLVVAPTRELATQVGAVFARMGRPLGFHVATLTGGVAYGEQFRALRQGVHAVVGTPGRLNDHLARGTLDLKACKTVVLDEADEILDMGFQEDLEKLLGALPQGRQTLLFSATLPPGLEKITQRYLTDPERLGLSQGMEASSTLTHAVYEVTKASKYEALVNLMHTEQPELAILFCHTKAETEELCKRLSAEGFKVGYLNGDLPQALRTKTLQAFRHHEIALLVATDVAARGIDVQGITHVVNYDIPAGVENYIHRSGRTGRAGRTGRVLNLVTPLDRTKIRVIAREAKLPFETLPVPQAEAVHRRLRERFFEELLNRIDANAFDDLRAFAAELIENLEPVALVAALLQDVQSATGQLAAGYDVEVPPAARSERVARPLRENPKRENRERAPRPTDVDMQRLRLNLGKAHHLVPGYLVRMICDRAKVKGDVIGAITLFARYSYVDVRREVAPRVVEALSGAEDDLGRRWSVTMD